MRWFKKIVRAILALLPMFLISFCVTSPSLATSHEIQGVRFAVPITSNDVDLEYDYDGDYAQDYLGKGFYIVFPTGTDFSSKLENRGSFYAGDSFLVNDSRRLYRMYPYWSNGTCKIEDYFDYDNFQFIGYPSESRRTFSAFLPYSTYQIPDTQPYAKCSRIDLQYSSSLPFDQSSLSNVLDIRGNTSPRGAYVTNTDGYWYSAEGFYTKAHHINTSTGESYNSAFYLSDLLNGVVPNKFTTLVMPIYNSDLDDSCVGGLSDRDFEFKGVFRFDGSFSWNPSLDNNSLFQVWFESSGNENISPIDCITNHVVVDGYQQLEFTCSGSLPEIDDDSIVFAYLYIWSGDSDEKWVWDSDGNWSFGGMYIVTDDNDTSGCPLGSNLRGGAVVGDYTAEDMYEAQGGAYGGLSNLFNFTFINPFASIFDLFSGGDSCASIPTLASMIHSEETQVCPWFASNTRALLTPVIGLSAMMLVFGFAVRWLGGSSGNMFADSGSIEPPSSGYNRFNEYHSHGWRRKS